jgi:hypothetical protein
MLKKDEVLKKIKRMQAILILHGSYGERGVYAGSGDRYLHQYWTRDLCLALIPAFNFIPNDYAGGAEGTNEKMIDYHFKNLVAKQGPSGAIPIMFSDFPELVLKKIKKCSWDGKKIDVSKSFVLTRILDGLNGRGEEFADFPKDEECGLYRLTPGTTDSELLFAYAMLKRNGNSDVVKLAVDYLEKHYIRDGLHHGADWRDTMEVFFRDKPLLTNNSLLYAVYKLMGENEKAEALRKRINEVFWTGKTYLDYPGSDRFDPLGSSLAVLNGLVPPERYGAVIAGFKSVDTDYGVTIKCRHTGFLPGEEEVINRTDGVVVWPFVVGFTVLASCKMDKNFAKQQFEKLHKLDGFSEWYDPADGSKHGEPEQGWSAALYILAAHEIE